LHFAAAESWRTGKHFKQALSDGVADLLVAHGFTMTAVREGRVQGVRSG
jgi:hypothetical protein